MSGIETLLLNILFLIVFLIFFPFFLEKSFTYINEHVKKRIETIFYSLGIISCMSFPIQIIDGFIFDLRWVALIFGILYTSFSSGVFLIALTIFYRVLLGGLGIIPNVTVALLIGGIALFVLENFPLYKRKHKIVIASTLSVIGGVVQIYIFLVFEAAVNIFLIITYLSLLYLVTSIFIYIKELIQEAQSINEKLLKAEKIEIVSHLASSISHEVRNPLTVVRGFLQMIAIQIYLNLKEKNLLTFPLRRSIGQQISFKII